jgi:thiol-disulfide isomerase/thioredoxin
MKFGNKPLMVLIVLSFVLTACGGKAAPNTMTSPDDTMMSHNTPMPDAMTTPIPGDNTMTSPAWFSTALTEVHTGETFTINDLKGKVVLVETMAVWCTNCFKQQTQVKALHAAIGQRDDFISMGMDIDPNEDAPKLKTFTETNDFNWKYVVAPAEVSRELASLYGSQFLNPPSTPMLVIDRHGVAHPLPFGIKSADTLMKALQPFLDEAM